MFEFLLIKIAGQSDEQAQTRKELEAFHDARIATNYVQQNAGSLCISAVDILATELYNSRQKECV